MGVSWKFQKCVKEFIELYGNFKGVSKAKYVWNPESVNQPEAVSIYDSALILEEAFIFEIALCINLWGIKDLSEYNKIR